MFRGFPLWLFAAFREFSCGYCSYFVINTEGRWWQQCNCDEGWKRRYQGTFAYSFCIPKCVSPWHEWFILWWRGWYISSFFFSPLYRHATFLLVDFGRDFHMYHSPDYLLSVRSLYLLVKVAPLAMKYPLPVCMILAT